MINVELASPDELMAVYQAVMAGKFSEPELLLNQALADASNRLVDSLLAEVRNSQNQPMVDSMEAWRALQAHYPQYQILSDWLLSEEAQALNDEQTVRRLLHIAAAPLTLNDDMLAQLLMVWNS